MPSLNQVTLIGNVTRDPSRHDAATTIAEFGIAVNKKWRDRETNDLRESTYFGDCKAFGRMAENIISYVRRGSLVCVTGELSRDEWTERESGKKRNATRILVNNFQLLDRRPPEPSDNDGHTPDQPPF